MTESYQQWKEEGKKGYMNYLKSGLLSRFDPLSRYQHLLLCFTYNKLKIINN